MFMHMWKIWKMLATQFKFKHIMATALQIDSRTKVNLHPTHCGQAYMTLDQSWSIAKRRVCRNYHAQWLFENRHYVCATYFFSSFVNRLKVPHSCVITVCFRFPKCRLPVAEWQSSQREFENVFGQFWKFDERSVCTSRVRRSKRLLSRVYFLW